jgi:light-regulated signal transduction histidine kinase (bacteriophytochrome)
MPGCRGLAEGYDAPPFQPSTTALSLDSPGFGQADLTNCERELIHLAGSVQPHGVLLVLAEPGMQIVQASANAKALLGTPAASLLNRRAAELGGSVGVALGELSSQPLDEPVELRCELALDGRVRSFDTAVHRVRTPAGNRLVVELEPLEGPLPAETVEWPADVIVEMLARTVPRLSAAPTVSALADALVGAVRELTGYDRVMTYKFDPDGHGQIIAEARDASLQTLLGHHYPASDIPQRARELYLRNRLRVLVDVHYEAAPLVPRVGADGAELDMSHCHLRSMSPLHLQYLKNMGVSATLVISLVRDARLWGLVACHHHRPRNLRLPVRAACALLAEVASTRIAAIENYAHAQIAIQVRLLEQRLVEATSLEGDWRLALLRNPRALLQPLEATGAALFHEGEILPIGESPSTPELRALLQWVVARDARRRGEPDADLPFTCAAIGRAEPALDTLTPIVCGVLAVRLSASRPDYLMWFRPEQVSTVTWAGDPAKPIVGDDPLTLSPRRSFEAWSQIVRGTAMPWTQGERSVARAIGAALADIVVQVNAVQLLIVEHQRAQLRDIVAGAAEPVLVADSLGRVLFANDGLQRLAQRSVAAGTPLQDLADWFDPPAAAQRLWQAVYDEGRPWSGQLVLVCGDARRRSVAVRAEVVPARDGGVLGYLVMLDDLSDAERAAAARTRLDQSLRRAGLGGDGAGQRDALVQAILAHASLAAMDIADGAMADEVASLMEELEASTQRATALVARIRRFDGLGGP